MEKKKIKFRSLSSKERQDLILSKMKSKGIVPGSGVPNKLYETDEIKDLIKITRCFPELRK
tara:strand:- start:1564 stop:1746 length:183 start_codon:yes stop_codon:yes gene_type:complete